jgi:hypothetical protein
MGEFSPRSFTENSYLASYREYTDGLIRLANKRPNRLEKIQTDILKICRYVYLFLQPTNSILRPLALPTFQPRNVPSA